MRVDDQLDGISAVTDAVHNQELTMYHERWLASNRIQKLKATIAQRAQEDAVNHAETKRRVLAHKSSDSCALEPGWDVV